MARLSLCVIARDEAAVLGRCLASVAGVVDEIVVGDTGSRDATPEIARAAGAVVFPVTWADDFSAARNAVLERATGDWALILDADEVLEGGAALDWAGLLAGGPEGYWVTVRNLQRAAELVRFVDARILRLFRRRPAYRFTGAIHESVERALLDQGARVADSSVLVLHDGYARDQVQGAGQRAGRNTRLLEAALAADPEDAYLHYQLGVTHHGADRRADARRHLQRALEGPARLPPELRVLAATKLAQLALADRRHGSAVAYAERALAEQAPVALATSVIARFVLGIALMRQGQHAAALVPLEWVLARGRGIVQAEAELERLVEACRELSRR